MRNSWRHFFRRLAVTTVVSGSVAWSSAMCYAVQLAYDTASDPVYADGWQGSRTNNQTGNPQGPVGDNGGFNSTPGDGVDFEPWNFDTDWLFTAGDGIHGIDDGLKMGTDDGTNSSSTFNDIGNIDGDISKAWRIAHPATGDPGLPRAGRGFPTLEVGQTLRVVVDNPLAGPSLKGYFVRFNSRYGVPAGMTGNRCYGGLSPHPGSCSVQGPAPEVQVNVSMFQDVYPMTSIPTNGRWYISDDVDTATPLYDTDKIDDPPPLGDPMAVVGTDSGMRIDLTITADGNRYDLTMTPLDSPGAAFVHQGELTFRDDGIDWIEFTFFNQDVTDPGSATDFYIRSIEIFDTQPGVLADYNDNDKVDAADYILWRNNVQPLTNEVVSLGSTLPNDYSAWRARFGNPPPGAGSGMGAVAVPEPGAIVLLVLGVGTLLGLGTARRRTTD